MGFECPRERERNRIEDNQSLARVEAPPPRQEPLPKSGARGDGHDKKMDSEFLFGMSCFLLTTMGHAVKKETSLVL